MVYKKVIGAKALLQNKELANVLPQFTDLQLQNVYSFCEVRKRIRDYIVGVYGGKVLKVSGNYIWIQGNKEKVIDQMKQMKVLLEKFYNATPSIVKNIRRDTKFYLPYDGVHQVKELKTVSQKIKLLTMVLENITYNPDFEAEHSIPFYHRTRDFEARQKLWMSRVGYKKR